MVWILSELGFYYSWDLITILTLALLHMDITFHHKWFLLQITRKKSRLFEASEQYVNLYFRVLEPSFYFMEFFYCFFL